MTTPIPEAARELLELERKWQSVGISPPERERWRTLVETVFGVENSKHVRRSFRLPAETPAAVRVGTETLPCTLLEVSRLGLTLSGDIFREFANESWLELVSVEMNGTHRIVETKCQIHRIDHSRKPVTVVGLSITSENDGETHSRFFDEVYYPFYVRYLQDLAEGIRRPTTPPP